MILPFFYFQIGKLSQVNNFEARGFVLDRMAVIVICNARGCKEDRHYTKGGRRRRKIFPSLEPIDGPFSMADNFDSNLPHLVCQKSIFLSVGVEVGDLSCNFRGAALICNSSSFKI
jgi:hypothetical protein